MGTAIPTYFGSVSPSPSSKTHATWAGAVGAQRLPADAIFNADLLLSNIIVGSRYRVTRRSTGAELATGVAASSETLIAGIPCYSNPMIVDITVRNASGSPAYIPFDTAASIPRTGAVAYILQQPDE